jgi:hypothetical protein
MSRKKPLFCLFCLQRMQQGLGAMGLVARWRTWNYFCLLFIVRSLATSKYDVDLQAAWYLKYRSIKSKPHIFSIRQRGYINIFKKKMKMNTARPFSPLSSFKIFWCTSLVLQGRATPTRQPLTMTPGNNEKIGQGNKKARHHHAFRWCVWPHPTPTTFSPDPPLTYGMSCLETSETIIIYSGDFLYMWRWH